MVVGALTRHWVTMVAGEEAEPDEFVRAVQRLLALLYAYNGILIPPWQEWIQEALGVLTGLFNWVVLSTNMEKNCGDDLPAVLHGRPILGSVG